jgi:hypothetical protein
MGAERGGNDVSARASSLELLRSAMNASPKSLRILTREGSFIHIDAQRQVTSLNPQPRK